MTHDCTCTRFFRNRIDSKYLVILHFVQNNISREKRDQRPSLPHGHPEGSFIRHNVLQANACLRHRTLCFANRTILHQHLALSVSLRHLWLPRRFFWASKRLKSLGAKTTHSPTDGSPVAVIWMEVSRTSTVHCTVHPWLDTTWLTTSRSSGETKSTPDGPQQPTTNPYPDPYALRHCHLWDPF